MVSVSCLVPAAITTPMAPSSTPWRLDGSFPESLPLPIADEGSYSPDGSHIAYSPVFQWQVAWKRYRGGQTKKIWLADLADSSIVKVPRENSNDFNPMWVGNKVYFLSDRNGPVSLFVYDTVSGKVSEALKSDGLDFKSASAGPGAIVIEQFGALHLYDLKSGKAHRVDVRVSGDLAEVRPHFEKLTAGQIENFALSPSGLRAVFESHGEILTVPGREGRRTEPHSQPGGCGPRSGLVAGRKMDRLLLR